MLFQETRDFLEKSNYPVSPMILGIILGPIIEINF